MADPSALCSKISFFHQIGLKKRAPVDINGVRFFLCAVSKQAEQALDPHSA